jgi:hypothetical protein
MATTKPRITVTLTERQHEVLKIISDCGGQSMSSLLGELIEVSLPTFERMANIFQKLRQVKTAERARMVQALDDAQSALEPIANAAVDQFDLFLGRIEQAAEGVGPQRSEDTITAAAPLAPVTNRGATPTRAKPRKPSATRVSKVSKKSSFSEKREG